MSVDLFKEQFGIYDTTNSSHAVHAQKIKLIKCFDSNGQLVELPNLPSVEIRFIDKKGNTTTFNFKDLVVTDFRVFGNNSYMTGNGSHSYAINRKTRSVLLWDIEKIELLNRKRGRNKFGQQGSIDKFINPQ
jgi:hypothetical protein